MVEEHAAPDEIPNQKKLNLTFIQYHFISIISHQSEKCSAQPLGLVSVIFQAFQENFRKLFSIILKVSKKMKGKNGVKTFCEILEFVWMDRKGHRAGRWLSSESSDDPSGGSKLVNVDYVFHIRHKFLLRFHQFLDDGPAWNKDAKTSSINNFKLPIISHILFYRTLVWLRDQRWRVGVLNESVCIRVYFQLILLLPSRIWSFWWCFLPPGRRSACWLVSIAASSPGLLSLWRYSESGLLRCGRMAILCLAALLSSKAVDPSSSPIPKSKWLKTNENDRF